MLSSNCKYCDSSFVVSKNSLYCCLNCQSKKGKKICNVCKKEFKSNAEKFLCSKKCLVKYAKQQIPFRPSKSFFWRVVLNAIKSNSRIVKKTWGFEIHVANNNNYCLKYLVYFKNSKSSFHFHNIKTELWHCICGSFLCKLKTKKFLIKTGDKIEIKPKETHQLKAHSNSIILEVSTRDFPEDSIRIK